MDVSVVIPSYNGRSRLPHLLESLSRQTLHPERFEVVVVLDGSTDGSADLLEEWSRARPRSSLRVIEQPNRGQSAARSRGAEVARAPLLLFLDDDVLPDPGCLKDHLRAHAQAASPAVVLGDAWIPKRERERYYDLLTRIWWEDTYAEREERYPHCTYRDFCSGHVSLPRHLLEEVGGFDPDFRGYGGEDYDLGYRLIAACAPFVLAPEAGATHDHRGSSRRALRNLLDEGRNDVRIGEKHPELRRGLRCAERSLIARCILAAPLLFRASLLPLSLALGACERLRLWQTWRWLFGKVRVAAYWVGVSRAFPGPRAHREYVTSAPPPPTTVLDITDGLPGDLSGIWRHGPSVLELVADGETVEEVALEEIPHGPLAEYVASAIMEQAPMPARPLASA